MTLTCRSDIPLPYYGYYESHADTVIRESIMPQGVAGLYYGYYGITIANTHAYIEHIKNKMMVRVSARVREKIFRNIRNIRNNGAETIEK